MHRTPTTSLLFNTLIIICIAYFSLQPELVHAHGGGCIPAERAALLSFKKGITSDGAHALTSWHGQDCCRWRGVGCSNRTGHVIKLHLRRKTVLNFDDGDYHDGCAYANSLFGEISPSLLSLKRLEHMDLSMNCLLGPTGHIPQFLGSMENLKYLNLSGMPFIGRVPSQLGNLSKLQHLDLGQVHYSGLSSTDITWLTKLTLLQHLSMRRINLSRIADWPHTLNMIPSLRVINLAECFLDTGSQPLLYLNLTKLEKLDLSSNSLGHSIASSWFWNVTSLKYLSLRDTFNANWLSGKLPDALGNMTSLKVLDVSDTNLNKTGNLKNLCSLEILDLSGNRMNGDMVVLMEGLPRCAQEKLQQLHLGGNKFTGTMPDFIGEFSSLSILDLYSNNIIGPLPPGLWNLVRLTILDLSENQLNGNVPTEIGALTSLSSLDMSANNLTGSIPNELGKLKHLATLFLAFNKITGPIPPEVMHSTSLTSLELSSNLLNGTVPTELGSLKNLEVLSLRNNSLSGVITEEHFANLKNLRFIDLSSNNLKIVVDSDWHPPFKLEAAAFASCQIGPLFPAWLQQLRGISSLDISSTGLEDKFPDWFWYVLSKAKYLDISNNQISGSLPHLDGMALQELFLGSNRLTGPIPLLPTNITMLDISNNNFSGVIPSNFGASYLDTLLINSNRIDGSIPESVCKLQGLSYLDLANNFLEGEIPQCSDIQNMEYLQLSNNSLSGKFPEFLQNNTNMEFLDLAWNKLSGRLPTWIGDLGNLYVLKLSHNAFFDNIPNGVTSLRYLKFLDLSFNNFSGVIPWNLSNLTLMNTYDRDDEFGFMDINRAGDAGVGNYQKAAEILVVTKGQQLVYGSTFVYFVSIDLSSNSLTGEIPADITSLAAVMNLNLSSNKLIGQIPNMIGAMKSLVSLDLSENKLSGEIPSSLSSLASLEALNLSYNNLSGRIPSGRQLDTLNSDNPSLMYIGNSDLCGLAVQKNCPGNDSFIIHGDLGSSKQEFEPLTFYFGLVLGFVAGIWMVFCALLFKRKWRIAYFRLFDKAYDQVYVFVVVKWARFAKNTAAE